MGGERRVGGRAPRAAARAPEGSSVVVVEGLGIACVVYAAKSSEDRHGSIAGQTEECRAAIHQDPGRQVAGEYADESYSAYKRDRGPQLAAAIGHCEQLAGEHGVTELWVQHSDRLARGDGKRARHTVELALWALKHEIRIRSLQDPDTFRDLLYAVVTGQRNHEDSRRKGLATQAGIRRAAARGQHTGPPPDGYRTVRRIAPDGTVASSREIDPDRRPLIRPGSSKACCRQGRARRGRCWCPWREAVDWCCRARELRIRSRRAPGIR